MGDTIADDENVFYQSKSIRDFLFNDKLGRMITLYTVMGGLATGIYLVAYVVTNYVEKPEPVIQQQVLGKDKPEIYIEREGVKYFSHVDGKEISDLFSD